MDEYTLTEIHGRRVLVMHGDQLCTDDVDYQRFRAMVRDPQWQSTTLAMPYQFRLQAARKLREETKAATQLKADEIMDVNQQTVEETMRRHGVDVLLHGHTHRPAVHHFDLDGREATRIVLGDWFEQGSVLRWNEDGFELQGLPR